MNVTMASIFMLVTATSLNSPNLINNYINEIDYKQFKASQSEILLALADRMNDGE